MNESTLVPREEMSDLDWLARNVHVWKSGYDLAVVQRGIEEIYVTWPSACSSGITKKEWRARRAELQNKPGWKGAPDWAEWLHQDGCGEWEFSEGKPTPYDGLWLGEPCKRSLRAKVGEVLGDWRDTLEKRPEGSMVSMSGVHSNGDMEKLLDELNDIDESIFGDGFIPKDAATARRATITPSKYTKTIHGVSVDVYDVLQAWGVSNPALQHLIKKALQCGQRGHKDNAQDLQDIIDSAIRAKELD